LLREKVAIATVDGKKYFLIVNQLKERDIPFVSLVPGEAIPAEVKVVITTDAETSLVKHENVLLFCNENELENLVDEVEKIFHGKKAYEKIVVGIDPGDAIGLAAIADGKVIEESNCFSSNELICTINKLLKHVDFSVTHVSVKIGTGVPLYKELLVNLDESLPIQVNLELVNEAGTNKPLKENKRSRRIRHISSAKRIAGRSGCLVPRKKVFVRDQSV